jgi:hypothetical protein
MPLSPSRTVINCPRCGTPINARQKAASTQVQQNYQQAKWGHAGVVEAGNGPPLQNYSWGQNIQEVPHAQTPDQLSPGGQIWLQGSVSQAGFSPGPPPQQFSLSRNLLNSKLGFLVAGLCVLTGGLLLVFVYFLAIGLPGSSSKNSATATSTTHVKTPTTAPTAIVSISPTTSTYPGQQYIDSAQMANTVDPNTLQPAQITTTFKTGQKIYVSFHLHPPHSGAACLVWYLNGNQITHYSFQISAYSKLSYAYAIYGSPGPAYVEIYWASATQCADQVLAQHVDFTVTK